MGQDASAGDGDMMMVGDGDQPGDGDGDGDGDEPDGGGDGDLDAGPDACIPLGCAELGYTCGMAKDNCGGDLNCEPTGGDPCTGFDTCGGDPTKPNQCGCTPKTCEDLGVACGTDLADGCGGTLASCGQGDCGGFGQGDGKTYRCTPDWSACECVPQSEIIVCAQRACGTYSDGCGTAGDEISCGECTGYKHCVENGATAACACDTNNPTLKAQACGDKTCGTVTTEDGCTFTCGSACVTTCALNGSCAAAANCTCQNDGAGGGVDQVCVNGTCCTPPADAATACGSQTCGEVTVCGTVYKCGNNGACANANQGCSLPSAAPWFGFNRQVSVPTCIDKRTNDLLGSYRVRTHAFRATGATAVVNRSEALSIVTVEINPEGELRMRDYGCYTTGIDINGQNPSIANSYYNLPELNVDLTTAGGAPATWKRPAFTIAAGFIDSRPSDYFCDTTATNGPPPTDPDAPDYDTSPGDYIGPSVTPSSGAKKAWLPGDKVCKCPANNAYGALPTENTSSSDDSVTDCRVNDIDGDGKPGYSVMAKYRVVVDVTLNVTAASLSTTEWWGTIDPAGRHYGFSAISASHDRSVPLSRKFLSCGGSIGSGLLCEGGSGAVDWGCGDQYDLVLFEKLINANYQTFDTFQKLKDACIGVGTSRNKYYTKAPADNTGQAFHPVTEFGPTNNDCETFADCREDEICTKAKKCAPMTTRDVCDTKDAPCRPGWTCANFDHACWPASCPAP